MLDIRNSNTRICYIRHKNSRYKKLQRNFKHQTFEFFKEFESLISEMIGLNVDSACYTSVQH
jgi:hypothetical protein